MNSLPKGWNWLPLSALCTPKDGIVDGPFGSNLKRSDFRASGVPVLKIQNIKPGAIILKKMDYVSEEKYRDLNRHSYTEGDIVMTKLGEPLGISALVRGIPDGLIVADLVRLRPEGVDSRFLEYQLNSPQVRAKLNSQQKGTTRARVNLKMVRDLPIAVPPIDVQQQIVETLEDQLSRLARAVGELKDCRLQLRTYARSIARDLISGVGRDLANWTNKTLGNVASWSSGGTPSSKNAAFYGGDIPWAVIGDLTEGPVTKTSQSITELGLKMSSAKIQPAGTVMLAMYGASIGRTGIASVPMATNQAIACAQIKQTQINAEFLLRFLQSQKQNFVGAGQGGAQPNISQGIIKEWSIKLPPIDVQQEISKALDTELEKVSRLSKVIEAQLALAETLQRSLLHAAFTGQLTNEDSND